MSEKLTGKGLRVVVLGGGNWGSAIARLIGLNTAKSDLFEEQVYMWLVDQQYGKGTLTDYINEYHENPVYLPGVALPTNVVAVSDLLKHSVEADLLVFAIPHQFVHDTCSKLKGNVKPSARCISLVKGLSINCGGRPLPYSEVIRVELNLSCVALSGANVASDVARDMFSESTLGFEGPESDCVGLWVKLLDRPTFKINAVPDKCGTEVCGALKNVIALGVGFADGLGYGSNTKAAIIRIGVGEMRLFANLFFDNVVENTFLDSCGYADVIATCFGGRNVKCAAEFARCRGKKSWEKIETEFLGKQKLQGHLTCSDVYMCVREPPMESAFPFFITVYRIAFQNQEPETIVTKFITPEPRPILSALECSPSRIESQFKVLKDFVRVKK